MSELILAIDTGNPSLGFQSIRMPEEELVTKGLVERIGLKDSIFTIEVNGEKVKTVQGIKDHVKAADIMLDAFRMHNIINDTNNIDGTGHRVVHGGEKFPGSVAITNEVKKEIEELSELAPFHNSANLMGIRASRKLLPNIPHVTIFDTAFHQTMPGKTYLYNLPCHYCRDYSIRKYGFHSTNHKFVSRKAVEMLDKPIKDLRVISCHIGNRAPIAVIDGGKSIDTSVSFTPLAGATMSTRSGNIDPALIPFIMEKAGKTTEQALEILNKESSLLGLSGTSSDLHDLSEEAESGKTRSQMTLDMFASEIHKYIGSCAVRIHGVDIIVFIVGIDENSVEIRAKVLKGLEFMGVYWDPKRSENLLRSKKGFINYPHSSVKVVATPTDEESMIARDVMAFSGLK